MGGQFVSILEQIRGPLSIVALSFLVTYAVYLRVLKLGVFQPIGRKGTLSILHSILGKLFWLALVALILGLGSYLPSIYIHKPAKLESSSDTFACLHEDSGDLQSIC